MSTHGEQPPQTTPPPIPDVLAASFEFKIGDRSYRLTRDNRRGQGFLIMSRGDLIAYASCLHDGEIGALKQMVKRLEEIEAQHAHTPSNVS